LGNEFFFSAPQLKCDSLGGIILLPILLAVSAFIQQTPESAFVAHVRSDLLRHPVEIVSADTVPTVVRGRAFLDVDGDGQAELFLAIAPKYRQTATLVIYRHLDSTRVERLYEGLAPGRLVAVSGRQIDTHTLGNGIDMSVEGGADTTVVTKLLRMARERQMQIVQYPAFFHVDQRPGAASYVDEGSQPLPATEKTCEPFEFEPIEALETGVLGADTATKYLAVLTRTTIDIYRFNGVTSDGRLLKRRWPIQRPANFAGLHVSASGFIEGLSAAGQPIHLSIPASER